MIFYDGFETRNLSLSVPCLIYDLIFSFNLLSHPKNCDLPGMEPHLSLFVWMSLFRQWLLPCQHILISKVTLRGSHYNRQKPSKTHAPTRIQPIGVVKGSCDECSEHREHRKVWKRESKLRATWGFARVMSQRKKRSLSRVLWSLSSSGCSGPPANPWAAVAEACDRLTELRVAVGSHRQRNDTAVPVTSEPTMEDTNRTHPWNQLKLNFN